MTVLLIILAILVVVLLFSCIRIVPQATEYVVEFLGKYKTTWSAGLHLKIPLLEVISKKVNKTKLEKYGKSGYNNPEKNKETCLQRYGVDNPMKNKDIQEKTKQTCLDKYGVETYLKSEEYLSKRQYYIEKAKQTCLDTLRRVIGNTNITNKNIVPHSFRKIFRSTLTFNNVNENDIIDIKLQDGTINAKVLEKR